MHVVSHCAYVERHRPKEERYSAVLNDSLLSSLRDERPGLSPENYSLRAEAHGSRVEQGYSWYGDQIDERQSGEGRHSNQGWMQTPELRTQGSTETRQHPCLEA